MLDKLNVALSVVSHSTSASTDTDGVSEEQTTIGNTGRITTHILNMGVDSNTASTQQNSQTRQDETDSLPTTAFAPTSKENDECTSKPR